MADQNTALPVRTEGDTTEKLQVRILDASTDANKLEVNAEGRASVRTDGDYDAGTNALPASSGMVAHDRNATPTAVHQNKRVTAVTNSTVHALDIALHDETGAAYSATNPLQVEVTPQAMLFVHDKAVAIAKNATDVHTLTAAGDTYIYKIEISASGKLKAEIENNSVMVSVGFNSTANPNIVFEFNPPILLADTQDLEITRTNLDSAQDLYSTVYYRVV